MDNGRPNLEPYRPPVTLQAALGDAKRVVLTAHVDPDADALGCALGLSHVLRREGWDSLPVCIGAVPSFVPFLPDHDRLLAFPSDVPGALQANQVLRPSDALVVCDTPTATRMEGFYEAHRKVIDDCQVVVFDHHFTNDGYGTVNFVDTSAAATAEVVCDVLDASGIALDQPSATAFMTALLADTQCFKTESTSPRSLHWGYRLSAAGAPIYPIAELLFKTRPLSALRVWGAGLSRLEARDGVVWTAVTQEALRESEGTMEDAEGLVDFLLASREARVAIVLKEHGPAETKVSMRTVPGVDATRIVGAFGGGGHQRAAGCTINEPPDRAASLLIPLVFAEMDATPEAG